MIRAAFALFVVTALSLAGCGQSPQSTGKSALDLPNANEPAAPAKLEPENTLYLKLKTGTVTIRLRPDLAPNHVAQVKKLTKQGFYDGLKFHRVIPGFMAQTGDPTGTGMGGSKEPDLKAEFTQTPFKRGTIGAARTNNPNTANSQFFICFAPSGFLNGKYTVWGEVVDGMEHVDKIAKGEPPANPDTIVKMTLGSA
jgi:cyclophilin family peptidyl-prolyl cis-trans isomerase